MGMLELKVDSLAQEAAEMGTIDLKTDSLVQEAAEMGMTALKMDSQVQEVAEMGAIDLKTDSLVQEVAEMGTTDLKMDSLVQDPAEMGTTSLKMDSQVQGHVVMWRTAESIVQEAVEMTCLMSSLTQGQVGMERACLQTTPVVYVQLTRRRAHLKTEWAMEESRCSINKAFSGVKVASLMLARFTSFSLFKSV